MELLYRAKNYKMNRAKTILVIKLFGDIGNDITVRLGYVIATRLKPVYLRTAHESSL